MTERGCSCYVQQGTGPTYVVVSPFGFTRMATPEDFGIGKEALNLRFGKSWQIWVAWKRTLPSVPSQKSMGYVPSGRLFESGPETRPLSYRRERGHAFGHSPRSTR